MERGQPLIATLGGQPQVVTFTLDLLLRRDEAIDQVVIVTFSGDERYLRAYEILKKEFARGLYQGRKCSLRLEAIRLGEEKLGQAVDRAEVTAVEQTFKRLFTEHKKTQRSLHISLTGGRRILALTALAASGIFLTHADRLWHIFTPDEIVAQAAGGALMHVPPEAGVRLVEIPFEPWTTYFPGLVPILDQSQSPVPPHASEPEDYRRCEAVYNSLTAQNRDILRKFAKGQTSKEIAQEVGLTKNTIDSHRREILAKCKQEWDDDDFNAGSIPIKFNPYFTTGRM